MLYHKDDFVEIHHGHALEVLKQMPEKSVDCVITSPPYWGLRTYKTEPIIWGDNHCGHEWGSELDGRRKRTDRDIVDMKSKEATKPASAFNSTGGQFCLKCNAWRGELGLEPTIELYIQHLILIFNEVKRVLKRTGTCWVNLDDSYAGGKGQSGCGDAEYQEARQGASLNKPYHQMGGHGLIRPADGNIGVPAKSLCLIPQRFALAMVENGWILRNDIIWNKPNPMPESVKDRFTGSWEHLFFFIKNNQAVYWTNSKTFKITDKQPPGTHGVENEDWEWIEHSSCEGKGCNNKRCVNGKIKSSLWEGHDYWFEQQFEPILQKSWDRLNAGFHGLPKAWNEIDCPISGGKKVNIQMNPQGRNKRDVWTIPTAPYPEAHFATFPEKLCETPILAGCPSMICKKCGKARERIYERTGHANKREPAHVPNNSPTKVDSTGWAPTEKPTNKYTDCGCNAGFEPGVTLDPFCGSGAALAAAKKLGRKGIGIDLNPKYCGLTVKRLEEIPLPMF